MATSWPAKLTSEAFVPTVTFRAQLWVEIDNIVLSPAARRNP